jgi:pilus assembly protein TadC
VAGVAVTWLLAGWTWAPGGVLAGIVFNWWSSRLELPSEARAREEIARDLPLAADLLAACVSVGRPVDEALGVVSRAVGGALAERLDVVLARLALGSDPLSEWRRAARDPLLAPLARTLVRTLESGAPIADALTRLAQDRRRERRTQTQLRARSVGVQAAGPLAACFLPAFMLIGIVPTVAGAFSNLVL